MTDYYEYMENLIDEARQYVKGQADNPYGAYHGTIELYTLAVLVELLDRLPASVTARDPFAGV